MEFLVDARHLNPEAVTVATGGAINIIQKYILNTENPGGPQFYHLPATKPHLRCAGIEVSPLFAFIMNTRPNTKTTK